MSIVSEKLKEWRHKKGISKKYYCCDGRRVYRARFGGLREEIILRDGEVCVKCGMTRQEHRVKYGRDITVDHIDGKGRNSKEKNNAKDNLQTLCLSCHSTKDNKRRIYKRRTK